MHIRRGLSLVLLTFFPLAFAETSGTPVRTNSEAVAKGRPDFLVQGECRGKTHGLRIVSAQGNKFYPSRNSGVLSGAGWDESQIEHLWGDLSDTQRWIIGFTPIELRNLGKTKSPPGSIILFDGSNTNEWKDGKMPDGVLATGTASKRTFQDFTLHFEFRNPFKPNLTLGHRDRGNSGIYIFGSHELQIWDTLGLKFDKNVWNEAPLETEPDPWRGSLYKFKKRMLICAFLLSPGRAKITRSRCRVSRAASKQKTPVYQSSPTASSYTTTSSFLEELAPVEAA
ncbi:MAG: hypothetical protein CMD87_00165 [Gammaproteobacteria bacterium]|nr:hypothetical protein [Gammaproteobacteria bacterium]